MLKLNQRILGSGVVAALLAACGGSQPPIGAPGAMPQSRAIAQQFGRGKSSIPDARRSGSLIYVLGDTTVYVLSYTNGAVVKTFANPGAWWGMCSDNNGNVFIPAKGSVFEYRHGGTAPIAELPDRSEHGLGCSVDSTTGDLAVVNFDPSGSGPKNNIAIYQGAAGKPTLLYDPLMRNYFSCTYDGGGNLVVDGEGLSGGSHLAELPAGSKTFQDLTLDEQLNLGDLQWDGKYVAVSDVAQDVYQLAISGSSATVVGKTVLHSNKGIHITFWLKGGGLLSPTGPGLNAIGFWKYPHGGGSIQRYYVAKKAELGGLTVSLAPHR